MVEAHGGIIDWKSDNKILLRTLKEKTNSDDWGLGFFGSRTHIVPKGIDQEERSLLRRRFGGTGIRLRTLSKTSYFILVLTLLPVKTRLRHSSGSLGVQREKGNHRSRLRLVILPLRISVRPTE